MMRLKRLNFLSSIKYFNNIKNAYQYHRTMNISGQQQQICKKAESMK